MWPIDVTVWLLILWSEILFGGFSVLSEQHSVNLAPHSDFIGGIKELSGASSNSPASY